MRGNRLAGPCGLFDFAAAVLIDLVEPLGHVLGLIEQGAGNEKRTLLGGDERKAIAGARVDLNNLPAELVFLLENEPGKERRVLDLGDDGALDADVEPLENAGNEVVSEGAFLGRVAEEHPDHGSHVGLDLDDEDFLVIADEDGASAVRRQDAANLDRNDVFLHAFSLCSSRQKTSPL